MVDGNTNLWRQPESELPPEQADGESEAQALLDREGRWDEIQYSHEEIDVQRPLRGWRAFSIRVLALLCASSLSIGSHYASYILGPLKSKLGRELGTSNTEFSLLISAVSLNSTWTPLVGGLMASRLGTTYTSILGTGIIFLGQFLLLIGEIQKNIRLMAFGLFVYGLGVSPLAVVQETIIVRFFQSHGLGVSLALGLIAGKGTSFISARTSYPLSEQFGRSAPFYVATGLTFLSFIINLAYLSASKWLIRGTGTRLEASEIREAASNRLLSLSEAQALAKVVEKRKVNLREVTKLDDVFWAYIGLNVLCGTIWGPFLHLAPNIFEQRYQLSEMDASTQASYLLAGSMILYPICGYLVDRLKSRPIVLELFLLSSALQLLCYLWLVLPPSWTQTPFPAAVSYGTGIGFSTLLLVVIAPQLVPHKYVSTTLGAHKSLEHAGGVIMQTFAGLALDTKRKASPEQGAPNFPTSGGLTAIQYLLNIFLVLNILQFLSLVGLAHLDQRRKLTAAAAGIVIDDEVEPSDEFNHPRTPKSGFAEGVGGSGDEDNLPLPAREEPFPSTSSTEQRLSLLLPNTHFLVQSRESSPSPPPIANDLPKKKRIKRGELFAGLCVVLIAFTWALFLGTAWIRLRSKTEREGMIGQA